MADPFPMTPPDRVEPEPEPNATQAQDSSGLQSTIAESRSAAAPPMAEQVPERIGKYEIVRELGRGSMGRVYEARHPIMRNNVAIKVIHCDPTEDPTEVEFKKKRLFDEARRAGILAHPNVVTVKDVDSDGETAFIVMEFVKGPTLEDWLCDDKPLDLKLALKILRQMADALDYAHSKHIIHRDVKPANVMIMEGDRVKVADFGIAKNLTEASSTKAGMVLGTPYYMAPEQILAKPLDGRADQFALAVIAFRLLTGHRAFEADSITALLFQIVHAPLRSPIELNKDLKPAVSSILDKALAKDPAARYQGCRDFVDALDRALGVSEIDLPVTIAAPAEMRKRLMYFGLPALAMVVAVVALTVNRGENTKAGAATASERPALPATMRLRQIAIDARNKSAPEARLLRERAVEVHRQLLQGADFAALARKWSDDKASAKNGGDMGDVPRGRIPSKIERSAFTLKPHELSSILDADGVFYIFQSAGAEGFPPPKVVQRLAAPKRPVSQPAESKKAPVQEAPPPPPALIDKEQAPAIPRPVQR